MANSVTLEVILEGKNLKVVQKDMDKLTTSTNKSATAQERLTKTGKKHHKGAKGVAGATGCIDKTEFIAQVKSALSL
mgnify:CR=1 FL=1